MNRVTLMGRLTRDPEHRITDSGMEIARFSLAVDFRVKGEKRADFFACAAFGKTAAVVSEHLHKGDQIVVEGAMHSRKYTAKDGSEKTAWEVAVDRVHFAGSRKAAGADSAGGAGDDDVPF